MRLLFCISYYYPYVSGLTLYVQRLAEAFARDHAVSVLCWNHTRSLAESEVVSDVEVVRMMPQVQISKGFLGWDLIQKSWIQIRGHDVVILNLPEPEAFVVAVLARFLGKKLVVIYHCEINMKNKIIQTLLEMSHWVILSLAHTIVTYTDDYAKHSRILKSYLQKVTTVYPPMPEQKDFPKRQAAIKKEIGTVDFVIGVAARLAVEKGFEYLFEAIPVIQNRIGSKTFRIVIGGSLDPVGEEAYKKQIMKLAETYKAYLVFLGVVPPEEMSAFYNNLDVLVLPSINSTEAFGMVQVEAMMAGVPVVASDLPGVRVPIAQTGMGKIVPIKDVHQLGHAVSDILLEPKKYLRDKKVIVDMFDVNKTVAFYKKLFSVQV